MNAEKINMWLSLGANFGVVIGLVLLFFEISQNTELMRAQINQSRTDTAVSEQQAVYNSDYLPALCISGGSAKSGRHGDSRYPRRSPISPIRTQLLGSPDTSASPEIRPWTDCGSGGLMIERIVQGLRRRGFFVPAPARSRPN